MLHRALAAKAAADEFLSKLNELIDLQARFEAALAGAYSSTEELPFGHLRDHTDREGEGVVKAVGLIMTGLQAVLYHRGRMTETTFQSVRGQMVSLALELANDKRCKQR